MNANDDDDDDDMEEAGIALISNSPRIQSPKAEMEVTVDPNVKSDDEKKEDEEEEEKVPDLGGTKRLNKEYANNFKCVFYSAIIFSLGNGILFPVAYGWYFPEIITFLTEAAVS